MISTRDEGLRRLEAFLPNAGRRYAASRNYDYGLDNRSNVSMLSPWVRHRLVREDEVIAAVLSRHAYSSAEKFIQEVVWRTYWKGWLEHRPGIWQSYRTAVRDALTALEDDADLHRRWQQAVNGMTGVACFDAWVDELATTGYLHNHSRMWFASIWIFTLKLPWELGADLFLSQLLDGDPASNTLSWRWVAGLQTRGKTYLARTDNIAKYTDGRFPQTPALAPRARPIDGAPPPAPSPLADGSPVDTDGPWVLLVHEDDCHPESVPLPASRPVAIAGFVSTQQRSPLGAADVAAKFSKRAVGDALLRAGEHFDRSTVMIDAGLSLDALSDWARFLGVRQIVAPYAPVGPVREVLDALQSRIASDGIMIDRPRRAWDSQLWPFATKGFFAFKNKIPDALRSLGVT